MRILNRGFSTFGFTPPVLLLPSRHNRLTLTFTLLGAGPFNLHTGTDAQQRGVLSLSGILGGYKFTRETIGPVIDSEWWAETSDPVCELQVLETWCEPECNDNC